MSQADITLEVAIGTLKLQNPILLASGTCGYVHEMVGAVEVEQLGGVIPKTVTLHPRKGNPPPRTVETPCGLLNSIGLDNDGIDHFIEHHLPALRGLRTNVIVNVAGKSVAEFAELCRRLDGQTGVAAIELNLSCPNVSGGIDYAIDPACTREVVSACRGSTRLPLIAKLTPNVTDPRPIAVAAVEAGADAISLINTVLGLAVDWRRRKPRLGAGLGGLSGPAIKPIALRCVWQVARAVDCPVIGIGGIRTIDDVMEFLVAGARAVQIGTANFFDPTVGPRLVGQLRGALESIGARTVAEVVGTLRL